MTVFGERGASVSKTSTGVGTLDCDENDDEAEVRTDTDASGRIPAERDSVCQLLLSAFIIMIGAWKEASPVAVKPSRGSSRAVDAGDTAGSI